jgi:hypothetical protein
MAEEFLVRAILDIWQRKISIVVFIGLTIWQETFFLCNLLIIIHFLEFLVAYDISQCVKNY